MNLRRATIVFSAACAIALLIFSIANHEIARRKSSPSRISRQGDFEYWERRASEWEMAATIAREHSELVETRRKIIKEGWPNVEPHFVVRKLRDFGFESPRRSGKNVVVSIDDAAKIVSLILLHDLESDANLAFEAAARAEKARADALQRAIAEIKKHSRDGGESLDDSLSR